MFERVLQQKIESAMFGGKAIIVTGARQVGKTTLINKVLSGRDHLFLDGDDPAIRAMLSSPNTEQIRSIIGDHKILFLDEAQRIPGIGLTLKIITDRFADVQLLVSGSSSFDLANEIQEPLTGRAWNLELYALAWTEYEKKTGYVQSEQQLENRVLYGMYPDVVNNQGREKEVLKELVTSYLYRDLLSFADVRRPEVLEKLLQALALQIGSEVNYNELAGLLGINKITVQKYIDILEKGYVVFRLSSFSRNLRNEITQNRKIYFYDTGVRNAVIGNFSPFQLRQDKGALWENFLITERLKQNSYNSSCAGMYFWRTRQQQEIDYVEDCDGVIAGYEIKWSESKMRVPGSFANTYNAQVHPVNRANFREFVSVREINNNH